MRESERLTPIEYADMLPDDLCPNRGHCRRDCYVPNRCPVYEMTLRLGEYEDTRKSPEEVLNGR